MNYLLKLLKYLHIKPFYLEKEELRLSKICIVCEKSGRMMNLQYNEINNIIKNGDITLLYTFYLAFFIIFYVNFICKNI